MTKKGYLEAVYHLKECRKHLELTGYIPSISGKLSRKAFKLQEKLNEYWHELSDEYEKTNTE